MKAVVINRFGGSDVLELVSDHPRPSPAANQVLINVHAAGVNPLDWKIRKGQLKLLLGASFPIVLGHDASGTIAAVGRDVTRFKPGDAVFGMLDGFPRASWKGFARSGAYAEMAVTREDTLAPKPQSMSHAQAASVPLAALTAYQALVHKAQIKPGHDVLINGASGGTGIFAVQIAKALGGAVTAVCSAGNHQLVADLGADHLIDYRQERITDLDRTFDIVYDAAATSSFARCRAQLKPSGMFISNLPSAGGVCSKMIAPVARFIGSRQKNDFAMVKPSGADLELIRQMIDAGRLRTLIDRTYTPGTIRDAHDYSQSGRVRGKLVIDCARF
ncbi:MAG: NAD(P)-dependent alcohol dehydrogenase [Desulfobacterales bacterium]|nr:NAD(P)-dependent alcohol dehydrogenase [Desulfobacterales bacterium]